MRKKGLLVGFVMMLMVSLGCGPIWSTSNISKADDALSEAKSVGAEQLAPYEYTSAEEYLKKARELWGYSRFGAAVNYAERSEAMSKKAIEKSRKDPWKNPLSGASSTVSQ